MTLSFISLAAAMSPGPDFIVIMRNATTISRTHAFYTVGGVATALLIHLSYILLGLGAVIAHSVLILTIVKYLGGGYLFFLGSKTLLSSFKKREKLIYEGSKMISKSEAFQEGFITNLLNPKAIIFLTTLFAQLISTNTSLLTRVEYGALNWMITILWFVLFSYLITKEFLQKKIDQFSKQIDCLLGLLLIGIGAKIFFS